MSQAFLDAGLDPNNRESITRSDLYGRVISNDFYLRGITATASVTVTRAQEVTLFAGDVNNFNELVLVSAANTSTNAIAFSIRSGTGGAILDQINVPAASANGAVGNFSRTGYWPPLPQSEVGQAWTVQLTNTGEISDSPLTIFTSFIKNPFGPLSNGI